MLRVYACLTQEHDLRLLLAAVIVCVLGIGLSVKLSLHPWSQRRRIRRIQIAMIAMLSGATIWSTHFIGMLAYDPGLPHAYEPVGTIGSFLVAIAGVGLSYRIATSRRHPRAPAIGGAALGLTISAMHFLGTSAYILPATRGWNIPMAGVAIVCSMAFCMISLNRIADTKRSNRWLVSTAGIVLGICLMHFVAMAAMEFEPFPEAVYSAHTLSDGVLGLIVLGVMASVLLMSLSSLAFMIALQDDARRQVSDAALLDSVTCLPNRIALRNRLDNFQRQLESGKLQSFGLLNLDLDMFRAINNLWGHSVGDIVLKTVAHRLQAALKENEFIARIGGDEFVAFKFNFQRPEEMVAFANRLRAQVVEPLYHGDIDLRMGASIGLSVYPKDGGSLQKILHNAELALDHAKGDPHRKICHFEAIMDSHSRERIALVQDLREALARDEFKLYYQIQNDVSSQAVIGFEVLLRWDHPVRGMVPPDRFIPVAEETGLIRDIGLWVLRTACLAAVKWPWPYRVAVNVAPQQLVQPSFVESVADILFETALAPERLELEITEASIIDDQQNTLNVMHQLKGMGVRIAMDDFGTGYSSLSTLRTFPFDKIKIDRSFIDGVHKDPTRAAIVRSTLLLGAELGIPVLAEGVEMEEDLDFLLREKCREVQGFLFGAPMSHAKVQAVVHEKAARPPRKRSAG